VIAWHQRNPSRLQQRGEGSLERAPFAESAPLGHVAGDHHVVDADAHQRRADCTGLEVRSRQPEVQVGDVSQQGGSHALDL
jgi:hypothetical protein